MAVKKFSIDAPEHIFAAIEYRAKDGSGRSPMAWRMIARYLEIINRSKFDLSEQFDANECGLIIDATNGVMLSDTMSVQLLPYGIDDAIKIDRLDQKWNVDGAALMEKLNATTYADRMAIADAVSIWWIRHQEGEKPQYGELFNRAEVDRDTTLVI